MFFVLAKRSWAAFRRYCGKIPPDIKTALVICVFSSALIAVSLTGYRWGASFFFEPVKAGAPKTEAGGEAEIFCLSPFIEMDGSVAYESTRTLLARLISAQVGEQSYTCQVAFGAMVLNRVKDPAFPQSVDAVIYQAGAFSTVIDRSFLAPPTERALHAARDALAGCDPAFGALYCLKTKDFALPLRTIVVLGDYTFYK